MITELYQYDNDGVYHITVINNIARMPPTLCNVIIVARCFGKFTQILVNIQS
jgi:hypothetical protein